MKLFKKIGILTLVGAGALVIIIPISIVFIKKHNNSIKPVVKVLAKEMVQQNIKPGGVWFNKTSLSKGDLDGYTSIGQSAFDSSQISKIEIPASITSIDKFAFQNTSSLTTVTFEPNSKLTTIGLGAFDGSHITKITIPNLVTSIGQEAFQNASYLTSITIPDSVTSIGKNALKGTALLAKDISIPWSLKNQVVNIGLDSKVVNGIVYRDKPLDKGTLTKEMVQQNIKPGGVWFNKTSLSKGDLDGYTSIGENAMNALQINDPEHKMKFTSIDIPDSVTSIGDNAFVYLKTLQKITIPDSVTSIGKKAFLSCVELTTIKLPTQLQTIAQGTFSGCSKLVKFTWPIKLQTIEKNAFLDCSKLNNLQKGQLPNTLVHILTGAFESCNGLTDIYLPDSFILPKISEENTLIYNAPFFQITNSDKIPISLPKNINVIGDGTIRINRVLFCNLGLQDKSKPYLNVTIRTTLDENAKYVLI